MQNRYDERHPVWERIRKNYKEALKQIFGENHKEIRQAYQNEKITKANKQILEELGEKPLIPPIHRSLDPSYEAMSVCYRREVQLELRDKLIEQYPKLVEARENYKAAKTQQYRKQFKEDYPEFEAEIDLCDHHKKMAINDIKRIIRPFYPTPVTSGFTPGISDEQQGHLVKTIFLICGTATALATYDLGYLCIFRSRPSAIINLAGLGIMAYALARDFPPDRERRLNLNDYIEAGFHYHKNERLPVHERRSLPNYKTRLQDETTNERTH